jgi:hypothetical protein
MKIKADIKVINDVTFSGSVTLEADTETGGIDMRVLNTIIELNRDQLSEFLKRTEPWVKYVSPYK